MAELETAEELYDYCYDELIPAADGIARIEARDKAVALRAKWELLDEIRVGVRESGWNAWFVLVNMSEKHEERCACGALKLEHTPERGCVKLFNQGPSK